MSLSMRPAALCLFVIFGSPGVNGLQLSLRENKAPLSIDDLDRFGDLSIYNHDRFGELVESPVASPVESSSVESPVEETPVKPQPVIIAPKMRLLSMLFDKGNGGGKGGERTARLQRFLAPAEEKEKKNNKPNFLNNFRSRYSAIQKGKAQQAQRGPFMFNVPPSSAMFDFPREDREFQKLVNHRLNADK